MLSETQPPDQLEPKKKEFKNNPLLVNALILVTALAVAEAVGLTVNMLSIGFQKVAIKNLEAAVTASEAANHLATDTIKLLKATLNAKSAACIAREEAMRAAYGCSLPPPASICVCDME